MIKQMGRRHIQGACLFDNSPTSFAEGVLTCVSLIAGPGLPASVPESSRNRVPRFPEAVIRLGMRVIRLGIRVIRVGIRVIRLGIRVIRLGIRVIRLGICVLRLGICVLYVVIWVL